MNNIKKISIPDIIWIIISILTFFYSIISIWNIILSPEIKYIQYIPDDGYYYLTLARNFSHLGKWTFDGSNVTSGFHLLWAYLLSVIYRINNFSDSQFVFAGMVLGSTIAILSIIYIGWRTIKNNSIIYILLCIAVLISSRTFVTNSISLTEWPLVVLCSYLYFTLWHEVIGGKYALRWNKKHITIFIIAVTGTLVRTDFIVLPIVLAVTSLFFERNKNALFSIIASACGVMAGLMLIGIHNYIFTGNIIQSSILIKAYWEKFPTGTEYDSSLSLITSIIGFNDINFETKQRIFYLFNLIPLVSIAIGWKKKKLIRELIGAIAVAWVYFIMYYKTGSVQFWWSSNLIIPVLFIILLSIEILEEKFKLAARIIIIPALILILFHNTLILNQVDRNNPPWPRNRNLLQAGEYLKQNRIYGKIASWNSGIIGYYEGGSITNIDGVVNNNVYPYIIKNQLYDYLKSNKIKYIIDFQNMITMELLRKRGGYNDPRFITEPIKIFSYSGYWWSSLTLWKLK